MKGRSTMELIVLMLTLSVCLSIIGPTIGIAFSSAPANEHTSAIRTALIDLLKVIVGGILVSLKDFKKPNSL